MSRHVPSPLPPEKSVTVTLRLSSNDFRMGIAIPATNDDDDDANARINDAIMNVNIMKMGNLACRSESEVQGQLEFDPKNFCAV